MVAIPIVTQAPVKIEKNKFVKMKKPKKLSNVKVTKQILEHRVNFSKNLGYSKQKWVEFCEVMMENEFQLYLYEARQTVSKYITVSDGNKEFKVRFSNHAPIKAREVAGDCDFFVGRTHLGVTNTTQAIMETLKYFGRI